MKKSVLAVVLMLSSVATFAQHAVGSTTIQPKLGLNIANVTNAEGSDSRFGLAVGAEIEHQFTDIFSVSAGALYSMQGDKQKDGGVSATLKLDYINIPILANVYVTKGLAVKLGVQPAFKVSSKFTGKDGNVSGTVDVDGVKTFDLAIPVGLSYEFNNIVIDGRYNWGVTKYVSGLDSKNSVFQFTVGYKFEL